MQERNAKQSAKGNRFRIVSRALIWSGAALGSAIGVLLGILFGFWGTAEQMAVTVLVFAVVFGFAGLGASGLIVVTAHFIDHLMEPGPVPTDGPAADYHDLPLTSPPDDR